MNNDIFEGIKHQIERGAEDSEAPILQSLKIGQKITHFCFGNLVEGEVIRIDGRGALTRHEPIRWGNDFFSETYISPSTYLQKTWGGTGEHGQPCKGAETTPAAFLNGKPILSPLTN